jgi:hypothetical protein
MVGSRGIEEPALHSNACKARLDCAEYSLVHERFSRFAARQFGDILAQRGDLGLERYSIGVGGRFA